jgi:hypothetical protein
MIDYETYLTKEIFQRQLDLLEKDFIMPRGIISTQPWATKVADGPTKPPYPKREPTGPSPFLKKKGHEPKEK